jgi:hypothetical protein
MAAAIVAAGGFAAALARAFAGWLLFAAANGLAALLLMAMVPLVTVISATATAMPPAGFRAGFQTDQDDGHRRQPEGQTKQISLHRNSSNNTMGH